MKNERWTIRKTQIEVLMANFVIREHAAWGG